MSTTQMSNLTMAQTNQVLCRKLSDSYIVRSYRRTSQTLQFAIDENDTRSFTDQFAIKLYASRIRSRCDNQSVRTCKQRINLTLLFLKLFVSTANQILITSWARMRLDAAT